MEIVHIITSLILVSTITTWKKLQESYHLVQVELVPKRAGETHGTRSI